MTAGILNYETDAAAFVEEDEGYPRVTGEESTPTSFVVLASAWRNAVALPSGSARIAGPGRRAARTPAGPLP